MDFEDLEPRAKPKLVKDLSTWSVADLEAYIASLNAEAERARQEAERKKAEAEAKAKAEAESARLRSAQREDYSLGSAEPAESLRSAPVKVTRSAEIDAAKDAPPAKSGCMGCGALILVGLMFAASGAVYLV